MRAASPEGSVRTALFGRDRRATTVGVVLLICLVAFESMGVGTAMPAVVAELGTVALYAWPFVAFLAAAVVGTVLGGRRCDVTGPRGALVVAPVLFGAGLLVAGTATSMTQLLVGRVLQGLGSGGQGVAIYVLVAVVYPARVRPAVFGLISSAWVLPSLVGQPLAALVTEHLSWRWVFLGLLPLVLVAVALVLPAVRGLGPPDPDRVAPVPRCGLVAAAAGAAAGVVALSWAGQNVGVVGAAVAVVAVGLLVPALRRLLPAGVFRARRGVATVVACRGLLTGTFFTVNSYLPLMLTSTHRWSLAAAGTPLLVGSLGWSAASAWQGRHPDLSRTVLLRVGFCGVTFGTGGLLLVTPSWGISWLALPLWAVAGLGMGLAFSSVSSLLLGQAGAGEVGFASSAAQMADQLGTATMVGAGGTLLALLAPPAVALTLLVGVLALLAGLGTVIAGRSTPAAVAGS